MENFKKIIAIFSMLVVMQVLTGCASPETEQTESTPAYVDSTEAEDYFTERDLSGSYEESDSITVTLADGNSTASSKDASINNDTITLVSAKTFLISGKLTDGMIIVDCASNDKVQIVFDGVDITSKTSAGLYIKSADKVFLTLKENSQNCISNGGSFVAIDENVIDAALFSKEDLTINGSGALTINSNAGHGIKSKDDLTITGGTFTVNCLNHALCGKDCVKIADGTFNLTSGKDGIHSENNDDLALGYVVITDGNFTINSTCDAISASLTTRIDSGEFNIISGEKGIKANSSLVINGGEIEANCVDDSVHSNQKVAVYGGKLTLSTNDDGIHADDNLSILDGTIIIKKSYEGLEGLTIDINGGDITLTASDDGINAGGGNDASGFGGPMNGQDAFTSTSSGYLKITAGIIRVNASGDGLDSNGSLFVSGGETYVSGPTDNGNGSLDYDAEATITGGILIATGSSGMAQNFGQNSTQGSILTTTNSTSSVEVTVSDANGNILISFTPQKTFNCIVFSCPSLKVGSTYTLKVGSTSENITLSSLIYGSGGSGHGGRR